MVIIRLVLTGEEEKENGTIAYKFCTNALAKRYPYTYTAAFDWLLERFGCLKNC